MEEINPYQQPQADVGTVSSAAGEFVMGEARKVSVGQGVGWIGRGMDLVKGNWGLVIGALVVAFLINVALQFVPFIGGLVGMFVMTILYAGIVKIFHRLDTEGSAEFADLFAGFSEKTGSLVLLALVQLAIYIGAMILVGLVVVGAVGLDGSIFSAMEQGRMPDVSGAALGLMGLVLLVAMMAIGLLFYFTIPLVFLGNLDLGEALGTSFKAALKNFLPLFVYWLVAMVLVLVGMIPLMLGLLFVMPILAGAYYVSFKDVFGQQ